MRIVATRHFVKRVKRLHRNQKEDLDQAVQAVLGRPDLGEQKAGDLAMLRVYKFRVVNQLTLLAYEISDDNMIILHDGVGHENVYQDLKKQ